MTDDRRRPTDDGGQRAAVVAEARSWIRSPYHNCADVKGAGVDCGMLLVRVFVDTGLVPPFDPRPYPPDWFLHRGEERYLGFVFDRGHEVARPEPGDVAVFRYGRCYSHGGIVTRAEPLTIVHAFHPAGMVLEEAVAQNSQLADPVRAPRFFSYWGIGRQMTDDGGQMEASSDRSSALRLPSDFRPPSSVLRRPS